MSTHCFVGHVKDDGTFRARYVHNDGYPDHMVPTLTGLIAQYGGDAVGQVLVEDHVGWSFVGALASARSDQIDVPDYGIAYTDDDDEYLIRGIVNGPRLTLAAEVPADWGYLIRGNTITVVTPAGRRLGVVDVVDVDALQAQEVPS